MDSCLFAGDAKPCAQRFSIDHVRPMLLDTRRHLPFNSPDWLFEIKNDGYRMLAKFGSGKVAMRTRGGHDCLPWSPEVADALAPYKGGSFMVDGEVRVMDDLGRSDFNRLRARAVQRCFYSNCDPVVRAARPRPCTTCASKRSAPARMSSAAYSHAGGRGGLVLRVNRSARLGSIATSRRASRPS